MTDGTPKTHALSHEELDACVASLWAVGGLYEMVAQCVERDNRPHCTGEETNVTPPWYVA